VDRKTMMIMVRMARIILLKKYTPLVPPMLLQLISTESLACIMRKVRSSLLRSYINWITYKYAPSSWSSNFSKVDVLLFCAGFLKVVFILSLIERHNSFM
jgi:hypothetical protein